MIGLALRVGGCGRFWSVYSIEEPQPKGHEATRHAIECSPPETTNHFEHRVFNFADDLWWL